MVVRNCSGVDLTLDRFELAEPNREASAYENGIRMVITPEHSELRDQDSFTHSIHWGLVGEFVLTLHTLENAPISQIIHIRNPALAAAQEACRTCNGEWGARGMLGLVGCICQTTDGGDRCHSSDECQGVCLFETFDEVLPGSPIDADAPICSEGQRRWVSRGSCSTQEVLFGCRAIIVERTFECRHANVVGRAPHLCVD